MLAARRGARLGALATLATFSVVACVVKDVELVEHLPGAASGGHAGSSSAGSGPANEAGETQTDGGEPGSSSGGSNGNGGKLNQGGSAGAALAGSAGAGQGGAKSPTEIPELNLCPDGNLLVCDDFETATTHFSGWAPGIGAGTEVTDAPSGTHVLVTDFGSPAFLNANFGLVKVSFWVKFDSSSDRPFLTFNEGVNLIGIGLERDRLRWLHASPMNGVEHLDGIVAPSNDTFTRLLPSSTWMCIEVTMEGLSSLKGRVVVPGDAPFDLPPLDTSDAAGKNDAWNTALPGWQIEDSTMVFGINGSQIEVDDLLVGSLDSKSLCDHFVSGM